MKLSKYELKLSLSLTNLHPDDAVDEEYECDEDADPGQRLERLDEGPEQRADALALREQFHEAHHAEQPEEVDRDHAVSGLQDEMLFMHEKNDSICRV